MIEEYDQLGENIKNGYFLKKYASNKSEWLGFWRQLKLAKYPKVIEFDRQQRIYN